MGGVVWKWIQTFSLDRRIPIFLHRQFRKTGFVDGLRFDKQSKKIKLDAVGSSEVSH
jgi:hypothetical protein